jgi:1-deoxy-D-xylulose-5-phosphate reductoisomerase
MDGLITLSSHKSATMVMVSVVGMIGIRPTIEAVKAKKIVLLANKESLVCAGDIIMPLTKKNKVEIRPVDSEHSAIWQCLRGENENAVSKIIVTASGGPFYGKKIDELKNIKVEDALNHPNWAMGRKITIDSSTLVNKGLEIMEAHHLFNMPYDKIEVVVQRESLIHSMVEFKDGAIKAQIGVPSMRIPIEYALYLSNRKFINEKKVDWSKIDKISIGKPDLATFKGLKLAYEAIKIGGLMPSVYNALNEFAVGRFLNKEIKYLDIADFIEKGMNAFQKKKLNKKKFTVNDIEATMSFAKNFACNSIISKAN